jgi:UDP-glucose:glycoprotein glucosyltransferase
VRVNPRDESKPFFDIVLVIDPLTRQAQHVSTMLRVLAEATNVNLVIYFNCKEKLSAPPLKSFYRYVLEGDVRYHQGRFVKPYAFFNNMPQSPILTMNIHPPESWMIEASNSPYDLDNICLKEIDADGAYGEYELEHLIIEGHAYDVLSGQSPRGLQFNLGTFATPYMFDTIVMANLVIFISKINYREPPVFDPGLKQQIKGVRTFLKSRIMKITMFGTVRKVLFSISWYLVFF